jgi:hypothetical protein
MTEIIITRDKLYPAVSRPGPAWRWIYSYAVDGAPVEYGTSLASLRGMLRRRFPAHTVRTGWTNGDDDERCPCGRGGHTRGEHGYEGRES